MSGVGVETLSSSGKTGEREQNDGSCQAQVGAGTASIKQHLSLRKLIRLLREAHPRY